MGRTAPAPAATAESIIDWQAASDATREATENREAARAELARLEGQKAQIKPAYQAAVLAADGARMREIARSGQDLDELVVAQRMTVARALAALRKAEVGDAQGRIVPAQAAYLDPEQALRAAKDALQDAERRYLACQVVLQAANQQAQDARSALTVAQQAVETEIAAASGRVQ